MFLQFLNRDHVLHSASGSGGLIAIIARLFLSLGIINPAVHHAAEGLGKAVPGLPEITCRESAVVQLSILDPVEHDLINEGPYLARSWFAQTS